MPAITPRSRALPYPRAISPINVDEIPLCLDTDVYDQDREGVDEEATKRAAKRRRRIRENAEAYLRGEQIYIMTASLKGPFGRGWKNPWAISRNAATSAREIPETSARSREDRPRKPTAIPQTNVLKTQPQQRRELSVSSDDIEFTQPPFVQGRAPTNVFKRSRKDLDNQHLTPTSTRRIEDWLKTNDAYKTDKLPDMRSSPTPAYREHRLSTPDTTAQRPVSAGAANNETPVGAWADRFSSKQDLGHDSPKAVVLEESTQQTHESQHRAEAAILKQKIRSVHRIPPSTNLPAFEYKRARKTTPSEGHDMTKEPAVDAEPVRLTTDDALQNVKPSAQLSAAEPEPSPQRSSKRPALSTETSKATTINHLPSALVVSAMAVPDGVSNVQSTNDLLQPVKASTEQRTQRQDLRLDSLQSAAIEGGLADVQMPVKKDNHVPDEVDEKDPAPVIPARTPVRLLDTQALLGSVKPFAISTIKKTDIKSAAAGTPAKASKILPRPRTAARSIRRKKASFAADPASDGSQSSIKVGFQVRKQHVVPNASLASKTAILEGPEEDDYNLDPLTSNGPAASEPSTAGNLNPGSFQGTANPPKPTAAPKSILKSRSQPEPTSSAPLWTTMTATGPSGRVTTNGTYQSTTASEKQDAQQPLDMFAIEHNSRGGSSDSQQAQQELEQFDLDAVIMDLGSYLGTWDVEKAAAHAGSD